MMNELLGYEKGGPYPPDEYVRVNAGRLKTFVSEVFVKLGVPKEDADIVADNLVAADLRGVESHGVSRLRRYVDGIKIGAVKTRPNIKIVREGPAHALVDGDHGLGQPVAHRAMRLAIEKAKENFIGVVGVRNSNHYGIAGYYARMALNEDLIGISLTNSRPLVAHTGAIGKHIGTNPIAVAVPSEREPHFLLDMATSIVTIGAMEVAGRKGLEIPEGWAIDEKGEYTRDPEVVIKSGALLPLGGLGELFRGYKGYGLGVAVDVLCGVLTQSAWGKAVKNTTERYSNVGHFFVVINPGGFISIEEFKRSMETLKRELKSAKKHPKLGRIWIHGEKAWLTERYRIKHGIPIYVKTQEILKEVAEDLDLEPPF